MLYTVFILLLYKSLLKKRDVTQEQNMLGTENSVIHIDRAARSYVGGGFLWPIYVDDLWKKCIHSILLTKKVTKVCRRAELDSLKLIR
jgi:hypothetical protein